DWTSTYTHTHTHTAHNTGHEIPPSYTTNSPQSPRLRTAFVGVMTECGNCQGPAPWKCSRCLIQPYCSYLCSSQDSPSHRATCNQVAGYVESSVSRAQHCVEYNQAREALNSGSSVRVCIICMSSLDNADPGIGSHIIPNSVLQSSLSTHAGNVANGTAVNF